MHTRAVVLALLLFVALASAETTISIQPIGRYVAGGFNAEAAEIAAYDPATALIFATNIQQRSIDAISIRNPRAPALAFRISLAPYGSHANSVAASRGLVAAAVENAVRTEPGNVVLFDTQGRFLLAVRVGAVPDSVTFSPDGRWLLVVNEGEPNDAYTLDPEGSVTIIDLTSGPLVGSRPFVRTATFTAFNNVPLDPSIRIFGPRASVAMDLEPEYLAVSPDSKTAWVTLQENNALGILDIEAARFTSLVGLGVKEHSQAGNGLDPSDRDSKIAIDRYPVKGMYQPDQIAAFSVRGETFLLMANEGDARDYPGFSELARVSELTLDRQAFPNAAALQAATALGRLRVTTANGDRDGDRDYDELWSFGGRSISIRRASGALVWDSGDEMERVTAAAFPANFNSDHAANELDTRSDDKGPEPEGVEVGTIGGRVFAFVTLERMGGVMVYDVTNVAQPAFVQYVNPRDFKGSPAAGTAGDLGPEGVIFIPAADSPSRQPLLVVSQEISGTITVYEVTVPAGAVQTLAHRSGTRALDRLR